MADENGTIMKPNNATKPNNANDIIENVQLAYRNKEFWIGGGGFTPESHEIDRKKRLHERLQHARLRFILEDAAQRAAQCDASEGSREILLEVLGTVHELASLTQAFLADDHCPWNGCFSSSSNSIHHSKKNKVPSNLNGSDMIAKIVEKDRVDTMGLDSLNSDGMGMQANNCDGDENTYASADVVKKQRTTFPDDSSSIPSSSTRTDTFCCSNESNNHHSKQNSSNNNLNQNTNNEEEVIIQSHNPSLRLKDQLLDSYTNNYTRLFERHKKFQDELDEARAIVREQLRKMAWERHPHVFRKEITRHNRSEKTKDTFFKKKQHQISEENQFSSYSQIPQSYASPTVMGIKEGHSSKMQQQLKTHGIVNERKIVKGAHNKTPSRTSRASKVSSRVNPDEIHDDKSEKRKSSTQPANCNNKNNHKFDSLLEQHSKLKSQSWKRSKPDKSPVIVNRTPKAFPQKKKAPQQQESSKNSTNSFSYSKSSKKFKTSSSYSNQMRKCHNCKENTKNNRRCHFWAANGVQCRKFFCRPCLFKEYGLTKDVDWALNDVDWHCPACMGICKCQSCVKERDRKEHRSIISRKIERLSRGHNNLGGSGYSL